MNRSIRVLGALEHRHARSLGEHVSDMAQTKLRDGKDTQMRKSGPVGDAGRCCKPCRGQNVLTETGNTMPMVNCPSWILENGSPPCIRAIAATIERPSPWCTSAWLRDGSAR